MVNRLHLTIS